MMAGAVHETTDGFWKRARLRALLPYVLFGVFLLGVIAIFGREIEHHIDAIETWIESLGPWGVIVFIGVFTVLSSLLLPDTVLAIVAGAAFGVPVGTIAVVVGTFAAASLQYFVATHLLRERIQRALSAKPSLLAVQRAVLHQELRLQILLRLTPLNPATISYVLGAAGVRFRGFILACSALVPNLFLEVYFGYAGKHLATMTGNDARTALVHDSVTFGGLLVCVAVMVVVSRTARRAVQEAVG